MLPQKQTLDLMQTTWATQLNPIIKNPVVNGNLLTNISLATGANTINHLLGRMMQGWIIIDQNALASIYRSQPLSFKTLTLTASADVTVSLYVF